MEPPRLTLDSTPPEETPTLTTPGVTLPLATADGEPRQRFLPGTRFGNRYRIVERLGGGGMGEIYRADDLQLSQPVALKFLPAHLAEDEAAVAHLRNEVRMARQVSHPNVCRVYDIGHVDGQYFLSMEYVDGEDLAAVLRRLGRPAGEKAMGFARQLCVGLAAAHANGVLHRDLKPANVMIDGRGRVRITDFGIAGLARDGRALTRTGGTPVYMAPELLRGGIASTRSDIYSLGLVLYEMFTGRPAFSARTFSELKEAQLQTTPSRPSKFVDNIDPEIERVIMHCLDMDPQVRPSSALDVAAVFPGGDTLAALFESGETPSPEVVAEAGPRGGLRPAVGLACLGVILVGLFLAALFAGRTTLYGLVPLDRPFAVLEERARNLGQKLGYVGSATDSHAYFNYHLPAVQYFARQDRSALRWEPLTRPGQIGLNFQYIQAPRYLVPSNLYGQVRPSDPYPAEGAFRVSMGLEGRLLRFDATPKFVDNTEAVAEPVDWSVVFEAAGLDIAAFEPIAPRVRPRSHSDTQAAWRGVLPHRDDLPVRVEATALDGRVVFFETVTPYDPFWSDETELLTRPPRTASAAQVFTIVLLMLVAACAVFMAVRSLHLGRGDRRGAFRLALLVLALRMLHWAVGGHHVPHLGGEFGLFVSALGGGLVLALLTWVLYVALEPYFRRLWPRALVGWTRMLAGRLNDPLVGRNVLIGLTIGIGIKLVSELTWLAPGWLGLPPRAPTNLALDALAGGRRAVGELFQVPLETLAAALGWTLTFLLLRIVLRRQWLAALAFCLVCALPDALRYAADPGGEFFIGNATVGAVGGLVLGAIIVLTLTRLGLLTMVSSFLMAVLLSHFPLVTDPGAPYFGTTLFALIAVVALAVAAFRVSLGGRSLFEAGILSESA